MNELLLRIETLCLEADSSILLGVGAGMAVVGLFLWLGGARYSTIVLGLLGAAVGAMVGMLVGQQINLEPFLSMAAGAVVFSILSILARNILVIVLATVIFALLAATVYTTVVLDGQPAPAATQEVAGEEPNAVGDRNTLEPQRFVYQSFSSMDPNTRQAYIEELGGSGEGFQSRMKVVLEDLWRSLGPHKWYLLGAILIGGIGGFLLIWFIKNVILPLCYSVVGTMAILLGIQLVLLALGARVVSDLSPRPWIIPATFGVMTFAGWVRQLLAGRKPHARAAEHHDEAESE
jgi:hypothetical protein